MVLGFVETDSMRLNGVIYHISYIIYHIYILYHIPTACVDSGEAQCKSRASKKRIWSLMVYPGRSADAEVVLGFVETDSMRLNGPHSHTLTLSHSHTLTLSHSHTLTLSHSHTP